MQKINDKEYDSLVPIIRKEVKEVQTSDGWQLYADGSVKGYRKKSDGHALITKGETIINIPYEKVVAFFQTETCMQKINEMMIKSDVVYKKEGQYRIIHVQIKTPFPLDNREAVNMQISFTEGSKYYIGIKSCNYPIEQNSKFVRAHMNIAAWIFERVDANRTKVVNFSDMDPKGNIPDFFKNFIAEKRVQALKDLQKLLKKEGY